MREQRALAITARDDRLMTRWLICVVPTIAAAYLGAAGALNFVVLVASLSAMNAQLYVTSRMMFSLSRGGYAPAALGKVNARGVPMGAIAVSCLGMAVAMVVNALKPEESLALMMSSTPS